MHPSNFSRSKRAETRRLTRFDRWESYCKGCGVCCYEKRRNRINGRFFTDFRSPCSHLNEATKKCRVYEDRFQVCKNCKKMTILHALFADFLPKDCGYVEHFRIWRKIFPFSRP